MAELIHATESESEGPFLIDRSQLEKLDELLNAEWARLQIEFEKELNEACGRELKSALEKSWNQGKSEVDLRSKILAELELSREFRSKRNCVMTLGDGISVSFDDLTSALRDPFLVNKKINGLFVRLESGVRSCYVGLSRSRQNLNIEVSPKGDHIILQTLTVLKNWQNSVRPPIWLKVWSKLYPLPICLWCSFMAVSWLSHNELVREANRNAAMVKAYALIKEGVSAQNLNEAVGLILSNEYGYRERVVSVSYSHEYYFWSIGGFIYIILLLVRPTVSFGIGVGESHVKFWRLYTKIVAVTLPLYIFSKFLLPRIGAFF